MKFKSVNVHEIEQLLSKHHPDWITFSRFDCLGPEDPMFYYLFINKDGMPVTDFLLSKETLVVHRFVAGRWLWSELEKSLNTRGRRKYG